MLGAVRADNGGHFELSCGCELVSDANLVKQGLQRAGAKLNMDLKLFSRRGKWLGMQKQP